MRRNCAARAVHLLVTAVLGALALQQTIYIYASANALSTVIILYATASSYMVRKTYPATLDEVHVRNHVPLHTHRQFVLLAVHCSHAVGDNTILLLDLLRYKLIIQPLHPTGAAYPLPQTGLQKRTAC